MQYGGDSIETEYLTQRVHLKHLTASDMEQLAILAFQARKHYNYLINTLQDYYTQTGKIASKEYLFGMERLGKYYLGNKFYIMSVARKNFYTAIYSGRRPPRSNGNPMAITVKATYKDGMLCIPATPFTSPLSFHVELTRNPNDMKSVTLIPVQGSLDYWEAAILYKAECPAVSMEGAICELNIAAIDIGIENFATVATNNLSIDNIIIDGKRLKGIIYQYFNSANNPKNKIRYRNQIFDYVNKTTQIITDYCIANNIKIVVLGEGLINAKYRKQSSNYFVSRFPFSELRRNLQIKLRMNGIVLFEVSEAFTSQASFIDGDYIPRDITRHKYTFSGKRKHRGLYVSKDGYKLNADINACYNILAKSNFCDMSHLRGQPERLQRLVPIRIDPLDP